MYKEIPGYPNYKCSQDGKFLKLKNGEWIQLKAIKSRKYWVVSICCRSIASHRLIAMTWKPNPENKKNVIFKDNNKDNLDLDNLVWSNGANPASGIRNGKSKHSDEAINKCIDLYNEGVSSAVLSKKYQISLSTLYRWLNKSFRKQKNACGVKTVRNSPESIKECLSLYKKGVKSKDLAVKYAVDPHTICRWRRAESRKGLGA
jgi:lambda repressor-like predicted transcriptional regulator